MLNFNLTKEELICEIKKTLPALDWCEDPIWNKKYGHYVFGFSEGFSWNELELENSKEIDLWKILAICHEYWGNKYEEYHKKDSANLQKVYKFSRECRKYIELEDTSYDSNFTMLEKALEIIQYPDYTKEWILEFIKTVESIKKESERTNDWAEYHKCCGKIEAYKSCIKLLEEKL